MFIDATTVEQNTLLMRENSTNLLVHHAQADELKSVLARVLRITALSQVNSRLTHRNHQVSGDLMV